MEVGEAVLEERLVRLEVIAEDSVCALHREHGGIEAEPVKHLALCVERLDLEFLGVLHNVSDDRTVLLTVHTVEECGDSCVNVLAVDSRIHDVEVNLVGRIEGGEAAAVNSGDILARLKLAAVLNLSYDMVLQHKGKEALAEILVYIRLDDEGILDSCEEGVVRSDERPVILSPLVADNELARDLLIRRHKVVIVACNTCEGTNDKLLAERLVASRNLSELAKSDISRLRMAEGLGLARSAKIAAAAEFARRAAMEQSEKVTHITSSSEAVKALKPIFDGVQHEECWVLFLTSSARIVDKIRVSQGGLQATVVDNRLIFKRALELLATQIVIAHNHPSGTAEPSQADITMTNRVKAAASLLDIKLLDHIIISANSSYSFREHNLL